MPEHLKQRLRKKGWTKDEIIHLSKHLKKIKRGTGHKILQAVLGWFILAFAVLTSISLSLFLVFLFIIFIPLFVYILSLLLGAVFGMLFEAALRHVDWIEGHHHAFGGLIILIVVIINLVIFSPRFISQSPLFTLVALPEYGSVLVGAFYFLGFAFPFFIHKITSKKFY